MDEVIVKLEARLLAMEQLLTLTTAMVYKAKGVKPSEVADNNQKILDGARDNIVVNTSDPAISDLYAAEYVAALERLLSVVLKKVAGP